MDRGWHLQLLHTEWVAWSIGDQEVPTNFDPVVQHIGEAELPFEFPENALQYKPKEHFRKEAWGWQFKSNSLVQSTGWELADTQEAAIFFAGVFARRHSSEDRQLFLKAVEDVREYKPTDNVLHDILNIS